MQVGKHSRKLVEIRKALQHGTLTADGLLPIEGPTLLAEALQSGIEVADVFVRTGATVPAIASDHLHEVPPDVFKTIQETEHSQGVIATIRPPQFSLAEVLNAAPALVVVLCRLQDPGNVGTILRISEAFGATGCIALRGTAGFYNSKVVRASAGSLFRLPHVAAISLKETVEALKSRSIRIAGTSPASEADIAGWDWQMPAAVFVGNEGSGLNPEELSYCETVLRIPHKPTVESLNSAIAVAVTLYEASKVRQLL